MIALASFFTIAIVFIVLLMIVACPICSAIVASGKGRDVGFWFIAGLIFGPFGLIAIAGLPVSDKERRLAGLGVSKTKKLCQHCREVIWMKATVCSHCTREVGSITGN